MASHLKAARWDAGRSSSSPYTTSTYTKRGGKSKDSIAFIKSGSIQYSGYLHVRTQTDDTWNNKYFAINDVHLLEAASPDTTQVDRAIPLTRSIITITKSVSLKESDNCREFKLLFGTHSLFFRAQTGKEADLWKEALRRAALIHVDSHRSKSEHSSAFPRCFQHCGYLDVRSKENKPWKRRYFVVNNNFLLSAATPHAKKLDRVIPLEGSNIRSSSKSSDITFELFIRKHQLYFRAASSKQCTKWTNAIEKASKLKIRDIYRFLYTLGIAGTTKVVAAKHRTTGEDSAIKIIDKRMCDKKMLKTEIYVLKKLDSPYIVQLYDLVETKKYLYLVMEKCCGGELFDQIAELDSVHFDEEDCCLILHQIANAVKYMHECGIVHRDLKPENVLCVKPHSIKKVKIADFGISKMVHIQQKMKKNVGTASYAYTAPEILLKKRYDYSVDFWSIGVIMFILLCGYPPFWGDDDQQIAQSILHEDLMLEPEDWGHVSMDAKMLVQGLLCKDAAKRKSCDDILKLTWKVSNKSLSFAKARKNFKQTVISRKLHRQSLSFLEKDYTMSRKLNVRYGGVKNTKNMNKIDSIETGKQQKRSWGGSTETQELIELELPQALPHSFFAITEENDNDESLISPTSYYK